MVLVVLLLVAGFAAQRDAHRSTATYLPVASALPLQVPNKTSACVTVGGLPDLACTPGAINPAVTQDTIQQTICVSGYSKSIRPTTSVTSKIKAQEMIAYGFTDSPTNYELDHLISLELGGAPADVANLWPEPDSPTLGYHQKDIVEGYLHTRVCSGKESLAQVQGEIAHDWVGVYRMMAK
jgi:hypothetical protein